MATLRLLSDRSVSYVDPPLATSAVSFSVGLGHRTPAAELPQSGHRMLERYPAAVRRFQSFMQHRRIRVPSRQYSLFRRQPYVQKNRALVWEPTAQNR